MLVYKIPYRRAPRLAYRLQPLGQVRRASKGILHTDSMLEQKFMFVPCTYCNANKIFKETRIQGNKNLNLHFSTLYIHNM